MDFEEKVKKSLSLIYSDKMLNEKAFKLIKELLSKREKRVFSKNTYSEKDSILITYGDSIQKNGEKSLITLEKFLSKNVGEAISSVHILPMYPYTSDDGFSVVDYLAINEELGTWSDIKKLSESYTLMFDAVVNHISKSSDWFKKFLECDESYKDYFIVADPNLDYSTVTRPRALPLLTKFNTNEGEKHLWTTFSEDQIDINFKSPSVLVEVLNVLLTYADNGAKYIRLDAIGYIWKEIGTSCIHLPEAHEIIKLYRTILDEYTDGLVIITETNVPHKDNISYFGKGNDEAHMVYQFGLPPLVMFTIQSENSKKLQVWLESLEYISDETTFFNFLSSHDGIGVRSTNGILDDNEREFLVKKTLENGGEVSYAFNSDGSKSPYELNINYFDAIINKDDNDEIRIKKFILAETILISLKGVPGIYIHSLIGSRNDYYGKTTSEIKRRINREKIDYDYINNQLANDTNRSRVFNEFIRRLNIRKKEICFSPLSNQEILHMDERLISFKRVNNESGKEIIVIANVSCQIVKLEKGLKGLDLLTNTNFENKVEVLPYETLWILKTI